jgi:hypothetical protein
MRIEWDGNLPKEIRAAVEPTIRAFPLPAWLEVLTVCYDSLNSADYARIVTEPQYRRAKMTLGAQFMDEPDTGREDTVRHELSHIFLAPIESAWDMVAEHAIPEDRRDLAKAMWEEAWESVVSDMCYAWRNAK